MIGLLESLFLGLVQGFLEWLPVSSSGNIILISELLGLSINEQGYYSMSLSLHFGTLLAVLYKYRIQLKSYLNFKTIKLAFKNDKNNKSRLSQKILIDSNTVRFILVSTIFTGLVGLPLYYTIKRIELNLLIPIIGILLIITGIILKYTKKIGEKEITSNWDMLLVGAAQGVAVLPGISRSGMTISALLFREVKSNRALELSFLISIPAITGAITLQIIEGTTPILNPNFLISTIASFITSLIMMNTLLKIADKIKFWKFCIFFGTIALLMSTTFYYII